MMVLFLKSEDDANDPGFTYKIVHDRADLPSLIAKWLYHPNVVLDDNMQTEVNDVVADLNEKKGWRCEDGWCQLVESEEEALDFFFQKARDLHTELQNSESERYRNHELFTTAQTKLNTIILAYQIISKGAVQQ